MHASKRGGGAYGLTGHPQGHSTNRPQEDTRRKGESKMDDKKNVYITLHKNFVHEGIEYEDRM